MDQQLSTARLDHHASHGGWRLVHPGSSPLPPHRPYMRVCVCCGGCCRFRKTRRPLRRELEALLEEARQLEVAAAEEGPLAQAVGTFAQWEVRSRPCACVVVGGCVGEAGWGRPCACVVVDGWWVGGGEAGWGAEGVGLCICAGGEGGGRPCKRASLLVCGDLPSEP